MPRFLRTRIPLRPGAACLCGSRGHVCLYVTGGCHQEAPAVTPQRVTTDSHAGRETGMLGGTVPVSPRHCDKVPWTRCLGAEEATPLTARGQKPRARVSESEPDAGRAGPPRPQSSFRRPQLCCPRPSRLCTHHSASVTPAPCLPRAQTLVLPDAMKDLQTENCP